MATAVLAAQDCLALQEHGDGDGDGGWRCRQVKGNPFTPPDQKRTLKSKSKVPEGRIYMKNVERPKKGSKGGRSLVMGQVTILKRGQTVKGKGISKEVEQLAGAPPAERVEWELGVLRSLSDAVDVTDGENYVNYPEFQVLNPEKWAGPAFVNSPSPSCLPFPKFSVKKPFGVDSSATRDLRRLLGLA